MQFDFTFNQSITAISASILSTTQVPTRRNLSLAFDILLSHVFIPLAGYRGGHSAVIYLSFGNSTDSLIDLKALASTLSGNDINFFFVAAADVDPAQIYAIAHDSSPEFQIRLDNISSVPSVAFDDIIQATICNGSYCDANTTLDLVIVLDASSSFTMPEFNLSLTYAANAMEGLFIGFDNTRYVRYFYLTSTYSYYLQNLGHLFWQRISWRPSIF